MGINAQSPSTSETYMCICMAAGRKIVIKLPYYRSSKWRIGRGGGAGEHRSSYGGGTGSLAGRGKRMGCDNSDFSAAHLWAVGRLSYVQAVGCHNVPYVLVTYTV